MEDLSQFECIICTELPIKVLETACCGVIICEDCRSKINECPQRCPGNQFDTRINGFVQRQINHIEADCLKCNQKVPRARMDEHLEKDCVSNMMKELMFVPSVHSCFLKKAPRAGGYYCDLVRAKNTECVNHGTKKIILPNNSESYFCETCEFDVCEECLRSYALKEQEEEKVEEVEYYPAEEKSYLHHHKMKLVFWTAEAFEEKDRCNRGYIGKCASGDPEGKPKCRYYACMDCQQLICEYCYKLDPSETTYKIETHKHPLYLNLPMNNNGWGCDVKGGACQRKINDFTGVHGAPDRLCVSYRCNFCDYDVCSNCYQVNKIV